MNYINKQHESIHLLDDICDELIVYIMKKCDFMTLRNMKFSCRKFYDFFIEIKHEERYESKFQSMVKNFNKVSPLKCLKWSIYHGNLYIFKKLYIMYIEANKDKFSSHNINLNNILNIIIKRNRINILKYLVSDIRTFISIICHKYIKYSYTRTDDKNIHKYLDEIEKFYTDNYYTGLGYYCNYCMLTHYN